MINYTQNFFLLLSFITFLTINGCGRSTTGDTSKNASESTEFFKEIGSVEQENTELQTSMEMQNTVVPLSSEPIAGGESNLVSIPEVPSIQDIQLALKNANIYQGKIDGILGPKTKRAIESFQSQNDLKADAKVGPKTWQKLRFYLNSSVQSTSSSQTAEYSSNISSYQQTND